jgi:hypothetical protein
MGRYAALLFLLGFFSSCIPQPEKARGAAGGPFPGTPLALIQAGENPLWFELAEDGPQRIDFPGGAELSPFTPWPLARHIRFILPLKEDLVLGVNGDGFLCFAPWDTPVQAAKNSRGAEPGFTGGQGIVLYRAADPAQWGPYTLAALFPFEDKAAALLYRDGFFTRALVPLPNPRAFTLELGFPNPQALEIPAFEDFAPADGWDLDALHAGPGGYWYYRAVRRDAVEPELEYGRTRNLDLKGEPVSISVFQNSALPVPLSAAPLSLSLVLEAVFALESGDGSAAVVSPAFPGPQWFSGNGAAEETAGESTGSGGHAAIGFYREPAAGHSGIALAILPGGQGFFLVEAPAGETAAPGEPQPLILPALPPGFVYTATALCGDTLIAAWEEQEGYSIGAAGFMVIKPMVPAP